MNRRMGFLKEFALAQKLICRLWGTVAAGWQVNASTVGAHILKKVLTEGGNVHELVLVVGASWCDGKNRVKRRVDAEQGVASDVTYIMRGPSSGTFSPPSTWTPV